MQIRTAQVSTRRRSSSTAKAGEPADAVLNTAAWQGAAPAPLRPHGLPRTGGAAEGGGRLRSLVFVRADGCPASVGEEAISHRGEPVARDLCALRRGTCRGSRGRSPSSAPLYPQGVGWLSHLTWLKPARRCRRETLLRHRPEQCSPGRREQLLGAAVAFRPASTPREPEIVDPGRSRSPQVTRKRPGTRRNGL